MLDNLAATGQQMNTGVNPQAQQNLSMGQAMPLMMLFQTFKINQLTQANRPYAGSICPRGYR